jgi:uncharacterized membrane protein
MRSAVSLALAILGCTSDKITNEQSSTLARVKTGTYVAVDLGTFGGPASEATGINPAGQIVGGSQTSEPQNHAFPR